MAIYRVAGCPCPGQPDKVKRSIGGLQRRTRAERPVTQLSSSFYVSSLPLPTMAKLA